MTKQQLHNAIKQSHDNFIGMIANLSSDDFCKAVQDKWTPAQHLLHIQKSVWPVVIAFKLPNFLLKLFFGKSNRPSKTYEELIAKYTTALAKGGRATGMFIPQNVQFSQKEKLIKKLQKNQTQLCKLILKKSDDTLQNFILPHPLLGKITLQEMLYFTNYHVLHHHKIVINYLKS